jgi:hypothetical protein
MLARRARPEHDHDVLIGSGHAALAGGSPTDERPKVLALHHLQPTANTPLHKKLQELDGGWGFHGEAGGDSVVEGSSEQLRSCRGSTRACDNYLKWDTVTRHSGRGAHQRDVEAATRSGLELAVVRIELQIWDPKERRLTGGLQRP